ncbi:NrfD/PsrC family molybdoenzyme membrane anchor subunit [Thermosulfurimonas dismutans]|uniref:Polysulfide reductase, membrane subunit NrfD subunit n=1 Tax=Thermosulfurimonas dismutans TaxID=999894 RepID=A0A179D3R7_9BACT|nr:NrfD/PsrC family molybdoenzyme membrane anchor subunit [Thermosulfurimonas dismutans]OAQ20686.1 Polysulfide reductase, membrane subunit NrfD subunit [Thermosulfurimonas dismutans]
MLVAQGGVKNSRIVGLFVFSLILLGIGLVAGLRGFIVGHEHVYGVTREVPWGILISTYVFWVVTSTGLCLTSSIGHVFGYKPMHPIASRSIFLAIATILSGFLAIGLELENPWRMPIWNVLSPNLKSNIWWMGTLYGAYLFFMLIEFGLIRLGKHKEASMAGLLGVVAGIAAHSNLGAVFGLLHAHEFWYGPYMPIYFIASAMMSGAAAIIFFTWLAYKLSGRQMEESMVKALQVTGKVYALLTAVVIFFTIWKIIASLAGKPHGKWETVMALMKGPYAFNFWVFEIFLGLVLPFLVVIGVRAKDINAMAYVAGLALLAIFVMRYDLVVGGQIVPHYHGMHIYGLPEYYHYFPSLSEWLVVLGSFGLFGSLFLWGEMAFDGHKEIHHH